jgi:hypothetical protein
MSAHGLLTYIPATASFSQSHRCPGFELVRSCHTIERWKTPGQASAVRDLEIGRMLLLQPPGNRRHRVRVGDDVRHERQTVDGQRGASATPCSCRQMSDAQTHLRSEVRPER